MSVVPHLRIQPTVDQVVLCTFTRGKKPHVSGPAQFTNSCSSKVNSTLRMVMWFCLCQRCSRRGKLRPSGKALFITWERFSLNSVLLWGLEPLQSYCFQHEVETIMGGEPTPRGSQGHGLWASGFSQLWVHPNWGAQLHEPFITLYSSLFQLHFSVTHRLKFPNCYPQL